MKRLAWSILLILPLGAFAQEIYRSVDANGVVVYSDRPSSDSEEIVVAVAAGTRAARATADEDDEANAGNSASSQLMAEIPREPTAAEIAADRARNCEYAQQMQRTYSESHRLFRTGADGEREYLSDAELTEARQRAESNVAAWCD